MYSTNEERDNSFNNIKFSMENFPVLVAQRRKKVYNR